MGLDIAAVSHISVLGLAEKYREEEHFDKYVDIDFINPHFPHAVPPEWRNYKYVEWGPTDFSDRTAFGAGSYGNYGMFRGSLAEYATGLNCYDDMSFWERSDAGYFTSAPFISLICFSDCEGVFYGTVCNKIHSEFVDNRDEYCEWVDNNVNSFTGSYFKEAYDHFQRAFELASTGGLVSFH